MPPTVRHRCFQSSLEFYPKPWGGGSVDSRFCWDKPWGDPGGEGWSSWMQRSWKLRGSTESCHGHCQPRASAGDVAHAGLSGQHSLASPRPSKAPMLLTHIPLPDWPFPSGNPHVSSRGLQPAPGPVKAVWGAWARPPWWPPDSRASAASPSAPRFHPLSPESVWNISHSLPWPAVHQLQPGPGPHTLRTTTLTGQGWGDRKGVPRVQNLRRCSHPLGTWTCRASS